MLTPLKCITSFAKTLERDLKHSPNRKEAQLILLSSKLLLSQVKMNLDRSLLQKGRFEPNYSTCPLNRVVTDVVEIMRDQAAVKKIKLNLLPLRREVSIPLDL